MVDVYNSIVAKYGRHVYNSIVAKYGRHVYNSTVANYTVAADPGCSVQPKWQIQHMHV